MSELKQAIIGLTIVVIFAVVVGGPIWLVKSKFEAEAYNRLTGSEATMWDAMWLPLRGDCD